MNVPARGIRILAHFWTQHDDIFMFGIWCWRRLCFGFGSERVSLATSVEECNCWRHPMVVFFRPVQHFFGHYPFHSTRIKEYQFQRYFFDCFVENLGWTMCTWQAARADESSMASIHRTHHHQPVSCIAMCLSTACTCRVYIGEYPNLLLQNPVQQIISNLII